MVNSPEIIYVNGFFRSPEKSTESSMGVRKYLLSKKGFPQVLSRF